MGTRLHQRINSCVIIIDNQLLFSGDNFRFGDHIFCFAANQLPHFLLSD